MTRYPLTRYLPGALCAAAVAAIAALTPLTLPGQVTQPPARPDSQPAARPAPQPAVQDTVRDFNIVLVNAEARRAVVARFAGLTR